MIFDDGFDEWNWNYLAFCECGMAIRCWKGDLFFCDCEVCPRCGRHKRTFRIVVARRKWIPKDYGRRWWKPWTWFRRTGYLCWEWRDGVPFESYNEKLEANND